MNPGSRTPDNCPATQACSSGGNRRRRNMLRTAIWAWAHSRTRFTELKLYCRAGVHACHAGIRTGILRRTPARTPAWQERKAALRVRLPEPAFEYRQGTLQVLAPHGEREAH